MCILKLSMSTSDRIRLFHLPQCFTLWFPKEWVNEASNQPQSPQSAGRNPSFQDGGLNHSLRFAEARRLDGEGRLEGCLPHSTKSLIRESILLPYTVPKMSGQVEKPSCSTVKGTVEWTNEHLPIWSALSVYYWQSGDFKQQVLIQQFLWQHCRMASLLA